MAKTNIHIDLPYDVLFYLSVNIDVDESFTILDTLGL